MTPHAGGCELKYTVHSKVGGKIAQLGQRLIDGVAKSLAEDFFKRFEEALRAKFASVSAEDATEQASAIQTTAPSAPKTQRFVWIAVAVVAVALLTWYVRR